MKTVKEVSILTGVSIRTLHHYDHIGLLKPTTATQSGYRLYDESALERLQLILLFRELRLSLKEIADILDAPDHIRNQFLELKIQSMQDEIRKLQNRICLAQGIHMLGVKNMNLNGFQSQKIDDYAAQAKALYGKTEAYREYEEKSKRRTEKQEKDLGHQVMDFFVRLGKMRPCPPDCEEAQSWVKELQDFFTEHFYTCTPQILEGLAESYAGGGSMTENIDKAAGNGTGAFAREVIHIYLKKYR